MGISKTQPGRRWFFASCKATRREEQNGMSDNHVAFSRAYDAQNVVSGSEKLDACHKAISSPMG